MALLTAKDVVMKEFGTTRLQEGYDEREVDEFLDQAAESIKALAEENEQLKKQLAEAESKVADLTRQLAAAEANKGAQRPSPEPMVAQRPVVPAPPQAPPAQAVMEPPVQQPQTAPAANLAQARDNEAESATGMLALAQKVHDEYVRSGQEQSDKLITDARGKASQIIRDAEETSERTLTKLEQDRTVLERKIDELRIFERDYRTRLRTYLDNLLADLEGKAPVAHQEGHPLGN